MKSKRIELRFPVKGLNESAAAVSQPGGQAFATAKCSNVVGFDPETGRNRGASRCGTRKYCSGRIAGAAAGQCLVHTVTNVQVTTRVTGSSSSPSRDVRLLGNGRVRSLGPNTTTETTERETTLIGVANGTVAKITPQGIVSVESGTACLSPTEKTIAAEPFFGRVFFCDGTNYKYYEVASNEIVEWQSTTGGEMPSQSALAQTITNASNAEPIVIATSDSHGYANGDTVVIEGVSGNTAANGRWQIANITADTFELVSSVGNGSYVSGGTATRISGSRCSLMAVWGGRIVMSGLKTDPYNVFMSAVGDPFDWDYSPAVQTVQQAVAGNVTSGYGKNPDIVTALIPYTDDVLLIGGTHSIRRQLGNPAEGGISASVTDITGIARGSAWCQSPEGIIYFFGSRGGVYKIEPMNGIPSRLTALTIDERLNAVDLSTTTVTLKWDDIAIAVRVYLTPNDGSATTNYVWDVRNEAWWPFEYANSLHNPLAVHVLHGDAVNDRVILEYGQDGYVRVLDYSTASDDGAPINSFVFIGPFSSMLFTEIACVLADNSNSVTWEIVSESNTEKALTGRTVSSGKFHKGKNNNNWPRAYIEEGFLVLKSTGHWSLERLEATVEPASETLTRSMRRR